MPYEYDQERSPAQGDVADIYVVRGVEQRLQPSREFLAALERLSPAGHSMVQELIKVGFEAMVRK